MLKISRIPITKAYKLLSCQLPIKALSHGCFSKSLLNIQSSRNFTEKNESENKTEGITFQNVDKKDEKSSCDTSTEIPSDFNIRKEESVQKDFKPNIPEHVLNAMDKNLHKNSASPIGILKKKIEKFFITNYCDSKTKQPYFSLYDSFSPKVSVQENFLDLSIPKEHPSLNPTDTFYLDPNTILRTHMTCHDIDLLRKGNNAFLVSGDCYRNDTIDSEHYPIFHQMDGLRLFEKSKVSSDYVLDDLKSTIVQLLTHFFGKVEHHWNKEYFPFTNPSLELEIKLENKWIEVLGCGVLTPEVLARGGKKDCTGWAFGIGLERLAMALFKIPDIRLFHTSDNRFWDQFKDGQINTFRPYSKFPACYKDVSFWIDDSFNEKEFFEIVKSSGADLVESIDLIDTHIDEKTGRSSRCYRVNYRSFSKSLRNDEVDDVHGAVLEKLARCEKIELR